MTGILFNVKIPSLPLFIAFDLFLPLEDQKREDKIPSA